MFQTELLQIQISFPNDICPVGKSFDLPSGQVSLEK